MCILCTPTDVFVSLFFKRKFPETKSHQLDEEKIIDNLSETLMELRRARLSHLPKPAVIEEIKPSESLSTLPSHKVKKKKKSKKNNMYNMDNGGGSTLPNMHMTSF